MSKIVLTGGGTAGHCIPNVALIPYLKKEFDEIFYIGSENGIEKNIIKNENLPYFSIPAIKLIRSFDLKNLKIPFVLFSSILKAKTILKAIKPDVVFSKGGYVSLPVVIASHQLNIPVISHESDYSVGLANKIASKYSKLLLTSFSDTAKSVKNGKFVGSPIRDKILTCKKEDAVKYFGVKTDLPVLLITGGSLGAKVINDALYGILDDLTKDFFVIHITGKKNFKKIVKRNYLPIPFENNMEMAFAISDLCVSRAGSNTAFELMALKKPTLFIPLSNSASRGDQILNANYFKNLSLCKVLYEENLNRKTLLERINDLYSYRFTLKNNFAKYPVNECNKQIVSLLASYKS